MKSKISVFITCYDISTSGKNLVLEFRSLKTFFVIKLKLTARKELSAQSSDKKNHYWRFSLCCLFRLKFFKLFNPRPSVYWKLKQLLHFLFFYSSSTLSLLTLDARHSSRPDYYKERSYERYDSPVLYRIIVKNNPSSMW